MKNLIEIKANRTNKKNQIELDVQINEHITPTEFTQLMESLLMVFEKFEQNVLDPKSKN